MSNPSTRSKRRGGNKHTKLIYKGGADDTPPLPYGGDLQAAMRAQDIDAIRTIMTARDNAPHSRINDTTTYCLICQESIEDTESIWSNITKCYKCKKPYHDQCIIDSCSAKVPDAHDEHPTGMIWADEPLRASRAKMIQSCPHCRAPGFCLGAKIKIELVKLHNDFENRYETRYEITNKALGWRPDMRRLLEDIVPMLSAERRRVFRRFVKALRDQRSAGDIPSLTEALMEKAPDVVGDDLWQQCIDRQREPLDRAEPKSSAFLLRWICERFGSISSTTRGVAPLEEWLASASLNDAINQLFENFEKNLIEKNERITKLYRFRMRYILDDFLTPKFIKSDLFDEIFKGLELINYLPKRLIESLLIFCSGDNYSNEIKKIDNIWGFFMKSSELYISNRGTRLTLIHPGLASPNPRKFKLILDSWVDSISEQMSDTKWQKLIDGYPLDIEREADFTNRYSDSLIEEPVDWLQDDIGEPLRPHARGPDETAKIVSGILRQCDEMRNENGYYSGFLNSGKMPELDIHYCYSNNIIYHVIKGGSIDIIKYIYDNSHFHEDRTQPNNKYKGLGLRIFNQVNNLDLLARSYHGEVQHPYDDFGTGYQEYLLEPSIWNDVYAPRGHREAPEDEDLTFFNQWALSYPPHYEMRVFDEDFEDCLKSKFLLNVVIVCALSIIQLEDDPTRFNLIGRNEKIQSQRFLLKFFIGKFTSNNAIKDLDCLYKDGMWPPEEGEDDISILARKIRELIDNTQQEIDREQVLGDKNLIDKIIPFTAGAKKRFTLKKKRNVSSKKTKSAKYFY